MHLNPYTFFALSGFLLGLTYAYFQLNFFKKYAGIIHEPGPSQNAMLHSLNWAAPALLVAYLTLQSLLIDPRTAVMLQHLNLLLGVSFIALLLYLVAHPRGFYIGARQSPAVWNVQSTSGGNGPVSSLPPERVKAYRRHLKEYLEEKRPYLDKDFRMRTVVEATGIPRHHLSALINSSCGKNFSQLINEYRIGYILQHIDDPAWSHLTLEGMGMEAGYRSRSTFLRAFKRITGVTPSEFRNRNE